MCPWKASDFEVRDGEEAMDSDVVTEVPRRDVWVEPLSMFVWSEVPPVHVVRVQVHPFASWGRHSATFSFREARCVVFRITSPFRFSRSGRDDNLKLTDIDTGFLGVYIQIVLRE
jgi:hypothetical protein